MRSSFGNKALKASLFRKEGAGRKKKGIALRQSPLVSLHKYRLSLSVAFFESFYPARSIDKFLLACIKRMAGRTDLGVDLFFGGSCLECVATQTLHGNVSIHGVDSFFHLFLLQ